MQTWTYEAITTENKTVKGTIEANTKGDVIKLLHEQNLTILHIVEGIEFNIKNLLSLQIGGIPLNEKLMFMKQFSTMVTAGLPITQALETLIGQIKSPNFRSLMEKVLNEVKAFMIII